MLGKAKFEIYKDKRGEWRWRLKAPNGRIMADSAEGYKTKDWCESATGKVANYSASAYLQEVKS